MKRASLITMSSVALLGGKAAAGQVNFADPFNMTLASGSTTGSFDASVEVVFANTFSSPNTNWLQADVTTSGITLNLGGTTYAASDCTVAEYNGTFGINNAKAFYVLFYFTGLNYGQDISGGTVQFAAKSTFMFPENLLTAPSLPIMSAQIANSDTGEAQSAQYNIAGATFVAAVPEPATYPLAGATTLGAIALLRRRRKKSL